MKLFSPSLSPIAKNKTNQAVEELRVFLRMMCLTQRRWAREIATFESHVRKRMIEEDHCRDRLRRVVLRGAYDQLKYLGTTDLASSTEEGGGASTRRLLSHRVRPETFLFYDIAPSQITPFSVYAMSRLQSNASRVERDLFFYSSPSLIAEYQAGWAMLSPIAREHYEELAIELQSSVATLWKAYGLEKGRVEESNDADVVEEAKDLKGNTKVSNRSSRKATICKRSTLIQTMTPQKLRLRCVSSSLCRNKIRKQKRQILRKMRGSSSSDTFSTKNHEATHNAEDGICTTVKSKKRGEKRKVSEVQIDSLRNVRNTMKGKAKKRRAYGRALQKIVRKIANRRQWMRGATSRASLPTRGPPISSPVRSSTLTPADARPPATTSETETPPERRDPRDYPALLKSLSLDPPDHRRHSVLSSLRLKKETPPFLSSVAFPEQKKSFENFLQSTFFQLRSSLRSKSRAAISKRKEEQLTVKMWLPIACREWNTLTPKQKELYR